MSTLVALALLSGLHRTCQRAKLTIDSRKKFGRA
jgi:hypothetical protein